MTGSGGADPVGARTPEEFVELLRRVRATSQLSFWEIQDRARELGYDLEPAALVHALGQAALPDRQLVVGLLASCGYPRMEIDRWMRAYHDLADAVQLGDDDEGDPVAVSPVRHPHRGAASRRGLVGAAAAALIVFAVLVVSRWSTDPAQTAASPATSLQPAQQASAATGKTAPKPGAPTPAPPQVTTQAPVISPASVQRSGTVTLASGQGIDLDTGLASGGLDIVAASGTALNAPGTGNSKRLQLMAGMPSQQTCQALVIGKLEREITGLAPGQWLCVRTSGGHWGRVNITATGAALELAYTVWS